MFRSNEGLIYGIAMTWMLFFNSLIVFQYQVDVTYMDALGFGTPKSMSSKKRGTCPFSDPSLVPCWFQVIQHLIFTS